MFSDLCIHPTVKKFVGTVNLDVGKQICLTMIGHLEEIDRCKPITVTFESVPHIKLPTWLRIYNTIRVHLYDDANNSRGTVLQFNTKIDQNNALQFQSDIINFETWELNLPLLPALKLQSLIGMRPVHVVVSQTHTEYARFEIQRIQHCTHIHR